MTLDIKTGDWATMGADAGAIRLIVFVQEQRVPLEMEWDELDAVSVHAVAYDATGRAVGTGRLMPDGHIGRMAVLSAHRGSKVGSQILLHLIAEGRKRGHKVFVLSAQTHAKAFYARFGFKAEGGEYLDAGIPHQTMRLEIL